MLSWQVFKPYECALQPFNAEQFAERTAMRRIIMIGDSLMRQQWMSLACLLSEVSVRTHHPCNPLAQHGDSLLAAYFLKEVRPCTVYGTTVQAISLFELNGNHPISRTT